MSNHLRIYHPPSIPRRQSLLLRQRWPEPGPGRLELAGKGQAADPACAHRGTGLGGLDGRDDGDQQTGLRRRVLLALLQQVAHTHTHTHTHTHKHPNNAHYLPPNNTPYRRTQ